MKNASTALKNYLATATNLLWADLWTIQLAGGITLYYCDADFNITLGGNTYVAKDVLFEGAEVDSEYGLDPVSTEVNCYPSPPPDPSMVGDTPFVQACANGQFNRANITRQRLYMPTFRDTSLGAILLFTGQITAISPTRFTVKFSAKDARNLLNIYMPPRIFQPTCSFVFGDSRCGFNRSSLAVNTTVGAGSMGSVIVAAALTNPAGFFNNGIVKCTSGVNEGLSVSIKNYNPGYVQLVVPFPVQPAVGDGFMITPGCNKTFSGPTVSLNAEAFFGSTPQTILNNIGAAAGAYNGNNLVFTSGGNSGQSSVILVWTAGEAIMQTPFSNAPAVGDNFNITDSNGNTITSGSVTTPLSSSVIPTQLPNADGFFTGGTLEFTSGANVGQTQTISSWQDGIATMSSSFGSTPAVGDECVLTSTGTQTQGSCTGYFGANAAIHFGGEPFIPVPETAY